MKNEHILPNTEVPIELRKEVYKEALEYYSVNEAFQCSGLCLVLPILLYGATIGKSCYN